MSKLIIFWILIFFKYEGLTAWVNGSQTWQEPKPYKQRWNISLLTNIAIDQIHLLLADPMFHKAINNCKKLFEN